jgi:ElaB/YqjD/DUF883 family membrane-anchored ribosome-binding protein
MGQTVEAIGDKADVPARAKDKVSEKVDSLKNKVGDTATRAKEAVTGSVSRVGDATPDGGEVKQQARRVVGVAQENPLGLAVGAAALGFLAGLVLPASRVEDERLGAVADQVKGTVKQTGQEALERGTQVAQEATQTAVQTAKDRTQEHGQDLAQSARQNAQEAGSQARSRTRTRS